MGFVLIVIALATATLAIQVPKVTFEAITTDDEFPYSHACSLQELTDGTVVAVFHAGSSEDAEDLAIYTSRRDPDTGEWTPVEVAAKTTGVCDMNPSLFLNDYGTLYCDFHTGGDIFTTGGECSTHSWYGAYVTSDDGGVTWSNVTYLPKGYLAGIKNKCITLSNDAVLCPSSTEAVLDHLIGIWQAHMETTDQLWEHWEMSNNIDFFAEHHKLCQGPIQPTLFELETNGDILALLRTSCGYLAQANSTDYGLRWPYYASSTDLMNPGAGIDGVRMYGNASDLGLLLMMNNSTESRCPLTLAHSGDWGHTWEHVTDIETDCNGSYEYPAIVQSRTSDRVAHVCFTYNYDGRHMEYARLSWEDE